MSAKKTYLKKSIFGAIVALCLLPALSKAGDINYTYTTSSTLITNSTVFNLPTFNSSLGTLQEVNIVLKLYSTPFLSIRNDDSTVGAYTKASATVNGASATLNYPTNGGTEDPLDAVSVVYKVTSAAGTVPGDTKLTFNGPQQVDTDTVLITNPSSVFTGNGVTTVPLAVDLTEGGFTAKGTSLSDILFGGGDSLYAMLSIDYIYCDCVPEPTSLALVLLSLGGLFLGRRFWLRRARATA